MTDQPLRLGAHLRRKRTTEPRRMRVQVRDADGRYIVEHSVEVISSGDDVKDARAALLHLRDLMVWGPAGEDGP